MSRIGRQPVPIPEGVTVQTAAGEVEVKGPKGVLKIALRPEVTVTVAGTQVQVTVKKQDKQSRSLHGLTRSLIKNMVVGVTQGFEKRLELVGTGYRVKQEGKNLQFSLGLSHPVDFQAPEGVVLVADGQNKVVVTGNDKQLVGQAAANIRALRPPEPYKGKGIRHEGEIVKRKAGKQAKAAE
jgi:large subunit ribosomal protein L6